MENIDKNSLERAVISGKDSGSSVKTVGDFAIGSASGREGNRETQNSVGADIIKSGIAVLLWHWSFLPWILSVHSPLRQVHSSVNFAPALALE